MKINKKTLGIGSLLLLLPALALAQGWDDALDEDRNTGPNNPKIGNNQYIEHGSVFGGTYSVPSVGQVRVAGPGYSIWARDAGNTKSIGILGYDADPPQVYLGGVGSGSPELVQIYASKYVMLQNGGISIGLQGVTTTTISGTQNSWAAPYEGNSVIYWEGSSNLTVNGIAKPTDEDFQPRFQFVREGSSSATVRFNHNSSSGAADERICGSKAASFNVLSKGIVDFWYDQRYNCWRTALL